MRKSNIKDRIEDEEVKKAYDKYETYLKELNVYDEVVSSNSKKVNMFQLYGMYKKNGIEIKTRQELIEKFKKFSTSINNAKKENPELDFTDISTQDGRRVISGIISETQDAKDFKTADLFDVALAENVALYAALEKYNEKKESKEAVLVHYDLNEQQFDKLQQKYKEFKKSGMMEPFNKMCEKVDGKIPSKTIEYAAAAMEDRPLNTMEALRRIGIVEKNELLEKYNKEVNVEPVSQLVKDLIRRDPNIKNPEEKISDLENAEYEKRLEHAKRLAKEADGKANVKLVGEKIGTKKIVVDPEIEHGRISGGAER